MTDFNVTVTPTVVGPEDRVLLVVGGFPSAEELQAIGKTLEDTFGPGRALMVHGDALAPVILRGHGTFETLTGAPVTIPAPPLQEDPPDVG